MSDEQDKPEGRAAQASEEPVEGEQERPTVAPPFDLDEYAKRATRPSPVGGTTAATGKAASGQNPHTRLTERGLARPPAPTITDPAELEEARRRSLDSNPVPRTVTPVGALSLANARVPSNLPPRKDSGASLATVDQGWDDLDEPAAAPGPPPRVALLDALEASEQPPSTKAAPEVSGHLAATAEAAAGAATAPTTPEEMKDRVALGDYTGALEIAERILEGDPGHAEALACAESCRTVLRQMYTARIGPLDRVPVVMVAREQLRWLSIDHRAGFVLSLVDGVSSLEMILDVSGMPELDALRILSELAQQRIISLR